MLRNMRSLCLDVCDYENRVLCNLYDNTSEVSGQATDVFIRTERNGWKELSFNIPSTCIGEDGIEENYRLQYLVADYRLRVKVDKTVDWFLISEPKITHNKFSKDVSVIAGHISQLLKTKNLGLEFSDKEGNNVGTAEQLLTTILDGTGWSVGNVAEFWEDDQSAIKVRSLTAEAKAGAFRLISDLCEKFEAKPIYNGDSRTVDIVPLNPFSKVSEGEIPQEVLDGRNVVELHYDKSVHGITRTLNTENLVTRLYAYGSYGDDNGLCSLQTVTHKEYTITIPNNYSIGQEFMFQDSDGYKYYFTNNTALSFGNTLVWSALDFASRSYVWNNSSTNENIIVYRVYREPHTSIFVTLNNVSVNQLLNRFDYLMDFDYYSKVGLLTDNMLKRIAKYQREAPALLEASTNAAMQLVESKQELSEIAESNNGFLRLDVSGYERGPQGELTLVLNRSTYTDGIMYRSDYDEAKRNYFTWYTASALKDNGDPVSGLGSVVYIIHDTTPVTWEKAYLKYIDGSTDKFIYSARGATDPRKITLWLSMSKVGSTPRTGDRFYLFCTDSISGRLGVKEAEVESLTKTLQQATKVVTETHPTYFVWDNEAAPTTSVVENGYGWYYRSYSTSMNLGDLYFCYGVAGETTWRRVYTGESLPTVVNNSYFFNLKNKQLYHGESDVWKNIKDTGILVSSTTYYAPNAEAQRLSTAFSKVIYSCLRKDMLYKGLYDRYYYQTSSTLRAGNYAMKNEYGSYWVFTTDMDISSGNSIWLDTKKNLLYQNEDVASVVKPELKPFDVIDFPVENMFVETTFLAGTINALNGVEEYSDSTYRSYNITVYPNVTYQYNLPSDCYVILYDSNRRYLGTTNLSTSGTFETTERTKYIRFVCPSIPGSNDYLRVYNYFNKLFVEDVEYNILAYTSTSGKRVGIVSLVKDFADVADDCYLRYYTAFRVAQDAVIAADNELKETLEDIHREGYWQESDYVEGDEDKLYKDALDNLEKIAKPEASYDIDVLDLYSSNKDQGFVVDESIQDIEWPDIDIMDAVHLIDPDIDVNCWAYIDELNKCYDQPWKTTFEINTNLSLIGQHSFTDVLTHIAEVASETKAKQTIYSRAASLSTAGGLVAAKLEGNIQANKTLLLGGASNWYTDSKGNIVLVAADGNSAMMLTGAGLMVANTRDNWGDFEWRGFLTGDGMTADEIVGGKIYGSIIYAGSIQTEQLNAAVGQELDISSNKALLLYATEDGTRPSGSLKTTDALIEIQAGHTDVIDEQEVVTPARINVASGGEINLVAGSSQTVDDQEVITSGGQMNIGSYGMINMKANSDINVQSGANINVLADGNISIGAGGNLTAAANGNVTVAAGGNFTMLGLANMTLATGSNLTIASGGNLDIQSGSELTIRSPNFNVYKDVDNNYIASISGEIRALTGNIAGFEIGRRNIVDENNEVIGTISYMYAGNTTTLTSNTSGVYLGTDGINLGGNFIVAADGTAAIFKGDKLAINAIDGTINMLAANTITIAANTSITMASTDVIISANNVVSILANGYINIGNSSSPFTIGSNGYWSYIYNGMTNYNDTTSNGVYLGTNGVGLGAGAFYVTSTGALKATNADISGTISATAGDIGGWKIGQTTLYADNGAVVLSSSGDYRFFAGNADAASSSFYVKSNGYMHSSSGTIGGWNINSTQLYSSDQSVYLSSSGTYRIFAGSLTTGSCFYVQADGTMYAKGGTFAGSLSAATGTFAGELSAATGSFSGTITASAGKIGGWKIGSTQIYANNENVALDSSGVYRFYAGTSSTSGTKAAFFVKSDGSMYAENATIVGNITATTGKIGFLNIYENALEAYGNTSTTSGRYMTLSPNGISFYGAGNVYSSFTATTLSTGNLRLSGTDVTSIKDGWISNIIKNGDTLTITKSNGTTINFSKPASGVTLGSLNLEAYSGTTFAANQYNDSNTVVKTTYGVVYLDDSSSNYSRNTWACVKPYNGSSSIAHISLSDYWDAAQAKARDGYLLVDQLGPKTAKYISINSNSDSYRITVYWEGNTYETFILEEDT